MTYSWLMAPHEYEPDYDAYLRDLETLEAAMADVATYDDWFPDCPIVAVQQGGGNYTYNKDGAVIGGIGGGGYYD